MTDLGIRGARQGVTSEFVDLLLSERPPLGPRFDELARNLVSQSTRLGSVVVTSPERGAGRSSVCLGLGAALARRGRRVRVIDCGVDEPHLHRLFGRPNFTGLTSALQEGGKSPADYAFKADAERCPGLFVVPTGPVLPGAGDVVGSGRLVEAVRTMLADGDGRDVALVDAPVTERVLASSAFCRGFGGVLLVVHATKTPKNLARQATDDLLDSGVNLLGVVLNGDRGGEG